MLREKHILLRLNSHLLILHITSFTLLMFCDKDVGLAVFNKGQPFLEEHICTKTTDIDKKEDQAKLARTEIERGETIDCLLTFIKLQLDRTGW